jgi:hypothetical protein
MVSRWAGRSDATTAVRTEAASTSGMPNVSMVEGNRRMSENATSVMRY